MKERGGSWIDSLSVAFLIGTVLIAAYFLLASLGVFTGYSSHASTGDYSVVVIDGATGAKLTSGTVILISSGGSQYLSVLDASSIYRFTGVPLATYTLSVSVPGYAPRPYTESASVDGTSNQGVAIALSAEAQSQESFGSVGFAPTSSCTDSDGGKEYYIKGTVTVGTQKFEDGCRDYNTLYENYCDVSGAQQVQSYNCQDGCTNGACIIAVVNNRPAYWQFNEPSWSSDQISVGDLFGDSPAIARGGASTVGQGVGGRAAYFDGTDDFAETAAYGMGGGGPITAMFWLRVNKSEVKDAGIFGVGSGGANNRANAYLWSDGNLYWDYGDPLDSKGRISINYGPYYDNWTHVALVSAGNGGNIKAIYINGKQVASASSSDGPDIVLSGLSLGMSKDSAQGTMKQKHLKGMLDEVNISYKVASADDIAAVYEKQRRELRSASGLGLVGYWNFDTAISAGAGAIKDRIGNTGGSASGGLTGGPGKVGSAAVFDGVDDEIVVPSYNVFSFQSPFTISGWFKTDNLTSGDITASWVSKREAYIFGPKKDGSVSLWAPLGSGGAYAEAKTVPGVVKEGVWQYWSGVYNGTHLLVYLDGKQVAIQQVSGSLPATSGDLHIGRDFVGAEKRFFKGSIDELQFYDYGLSAEQVDALFKAQLAVAAATPAAPTAITACGTIDKEGSYQLTQPLTSSTTCLTITANNVILNGQGHAVSVAAAATADPLAKNVITTGIAARNANSLTLKNIKVEGFGTGVLLHKAEKAVLEDVVITQSVEVGLHLNDTNQALVSRSNIEHGSGSGVWFVRSNNNRADRVRIRSNVAYGINFVSSSDNALSRMTFADNGLGNVKNDSTSKNNVIELAGSDEPPAPTPPFVAQPTDLAKGYNTTLGVGETRFFRVGTTTYNLSIVNLLNGKLTVLIKPAGAFTLAQGETQSIDLNVNGRADLNVTFLGTVNNKPQIMLKTFPEAAAPGPLNPGGPAGSGSTGNRSDVTTLTNTTNASKQDGFSFASWDTKTMIIVIVALIIFIIFVIIAIIYAVKQQRTGVDNEFYVPEPHSSVLQPSFGGP